MKLLRSLLPVVALLCAPAVGLAPRLSAEEFDPKALYKKVVKSAVFILAPVKENKNAVAMGSGSLIDAGKGLILTNYHVVMEEPYVAVQFPIFVKDTMITDKEVYMENALKLNKALKGKVLHRDKSRDLALVEVPRVPAGTPALPLARESAEQGQDVWQIGSPGDVEQVFSVSRGEVRAVAIEDILVGGGGGDVFRVKCRVVTATNPINGGDSGGPLFNKKGEQVAVSESSRTRASLVNFFIDVTEVRALLKEKNIKIKELTPEPETPAVDKKDTVPPKKDGPGGPSVPPKKEGAAAAPVVNEKAENEAAELLRRANLFKDDTDQKDYYHSRLKEVIKKYPGTKAAKEAESRLK
jgi:S1-C subfamily serine protease